MTSPRRIAQIALAVAVVWPSFALGLERGLVKSHVGAFEEQGEKRTRGSDNVAPDEHWAKVSRSQNVALDLKVFLHHNHLGSTAQTTRFDNNANIDNTTTYWLYGRTRYENKPTEPYAWAGQERDYEVRLSHHGARELDLHSGQFQSVDPLAISDPNFALEHPLEAVGAYSYALGNPINATDPDGLSGLLEIHSSGNSIIDGHSWIVYRQDGGTTKTYGTWGNNPTGQGNGLFENLELGRQSDASRVSYLDDVAEGQLMNTVNGYRGLGEDAWRYDAPCSSFAREAWTRSTGEDLNSNWGPISNPTTLKKSIIEANGGALRSFEGVPNGTSSASSGSAGRSYGSSYMRASSAVAESPSSAVERKISATSLEGNQ